METCAELSCAVDIGGPSTGLVAYDPNSGEFHFRKTAALRCMHCTLSPHRAVVTCWSCAVQATRCPSKSREWNESQRASRIVRVLVSGTGRFAL